VPQDGFVIGWNNSNEAPNDDTTSVSRLAFRNSTGDLTKAESRHNGGNYGLTVSGSYVPGMMPDSVTIQRMSNRIVGYWSVPASLGR
jgi:hypothetical protein